MKHIGKREITFRHLATLAAGKGIGLYGDGILLTLQLLYYRNWVSRIKYTHGQLYYGTHGKPKNTLNRELSVLVVVTHTHPTIPNMFIPP